MAKPLIGFGTTPGITSSDNFLRIRKFGQRLFALGGWVNQAIIYEIMPNHEAVPFVWFDNVVTDFDILGDKIYIVVSEGIKVWNAALGRDAALATSSTPGIYSVDLLTKQKTLLKALSEFKPAAYDGLIENSWGIAADSDHNCLWIAGEWNISKFDLSTLTLTEEYGRRYSDYPATHIFDAAARYGAYQQEPTLAKSQLTQYGNLHPTILALQPLGSGSYTPNAGQPSYTGFKFLEFCFVGETAEGFVVRASAPVAIDSIDGNGYELNFTPPSPDIYQKMRMYLKIASDSNKFASYQPRDDRPYDENDPTTYSQEVWISFDVPNIVQPFTFRLANSSDSIYAYINGAMDYEVLFSPISGKANAYNVRSGYPEQFNQGNMYFRPWWPSALTYHQGKLYGSDVYGTARENVNPGDSRMRSFIIDINTNTLINDPIDGVVNELNSNCYRLTAFHPTNPRIKYIVAGEGDETSSIVRLTDGNFVERLFSMRFNGYDQNGSWVRYSNIGDIGNEPYETAGCSIYDAIVNDDGSLWMIDYGGHILKTFTGLSSAQIFPSYYHDGVGSQTLGPIYREGCNGKISAFFRVNLKLGESVKFTGTSSLLQTTYLSVTGIDGTPVGRWGDSSDYADEINFVAPYAGPYGVEVAVQENYDPTQIITLTMAANEDSEGANNTIHSALPLGDSVYFVSTDIGGTTSIVKLLLGRRIANIIANSDIPPGTLRYGTTPQSNIVVMYPIFVQNNDGGGWGERFSPMEREWGGNNIVTDRRVFIVKDDVLTVLKPPVILDDEFNIDNSAGALVGTILVEDVAPGKMIRVFYGTNSRIYITEYVGQNQTESTWRVLHSFAKRFDGFSISVPEMQIIGKSVNDFVVYTSSKDPSLPLIIRKLNGQIITESTDVYEFNGEGYVKQPNTTSRVFGKDVTLLNGDYSLSNVGLAQSVASELNRDME